MKTMRFSAGLLVLGAASLACSGKYEVGGNDAATAGSDAGGTHSFGGSVAGGAAAGAFGTAGNAVVGSAGASSVGVGMPADEFGPQCVPSGAPTPLSGPFAKPDVVWSRLALLIWGKPGPALSAFPPTTTYAWASDVVTQGFAHANRMLGSAPGARLFVAQWLKLEDPHFVGLYEKLLPSDVPALDVLLRAPLGETGRVGVFTEPSWLALHTRITARGVAMFGTVVQQQVPPSPAGLQNPTPNPSLPDRVALEQLLTNPACASCHQLMDPVGYALGHFGSDATYRKLDHNQPIDTTGSISILFGQSKVMFDGIEDFGAKLADRCEPTLALADGFLKVALDLAGFPQEQHEALFIANTDRVRQAFIAGGRSYPALVTAFAQSEAVLRP